MYMTADQQFVHNLYNDTALTFSSSFKGLYDWSGRALSVTTQCQHNDKTFLLPYMTIVVEWVVK